MSKELFRDVAQIYQHRALESAGMPEATEYIVHAKRYREAADIIEQQAERISELRADAERLDFLNATGSRFIQSCGIRWYSRTDYNQPHTRHETLRAAIDAAREAK